ncbi:hypothetical protein BT69DRAFT_1339849 [Atractiella rhizophila]|nr:hypothetical protein BT69DRAFT_1339849 [Atractiella rhizophila]
MYLKTLIGLSLGLDATLKVAKKANIYTTMKKTGGRQKNLWDTNFLLETHRSRWVHHFKILLNVHGSLESTLKVAGQACVDLCSQHRNSILLYVPELWIGQGLAHLEMCVFETIPHINPARADFIVAFRDAILKKKADLYGGVAEYYSVEESLERLTKVEDKFKKNPDL